MYNMWLTLSELPNSPFLADGVKYTIQATCPVNISPHLAKLDQLNHQSSL